MGAGTDSDSFVSPVIKYLLFVFNFLFWLIGATLTGIGAWAFHEKNRFETDMEDMTFYDVVFDLSIITMTVGIVVFVVTFTGFVGALRENLCLLRMFVVLLAIVFLGEVALAVLAFVFMNQIKFKVLKMEGLARYRDDLDLQNFIDWMQRTMFSLVCGYDTQNLNAGEAGDLIYTEGCVDSLISVAKDNLILIGAAVLGISITQVLGVAFGAIMMRDIQMERDWSLRK